MSHNEIILTIIIVGVALWGLLMWRTTLGDVRRLEQAVKDGAELAEKGIAELTEDRDGWEESACELANAKGVLEAEVERLTRDVTNLNERGETLNGEKASLTDELNAANTAIETSRTELRFLRAEKETAEQNFMRANGENERHKVENAALARQLRDERLKVADLRRDLKRSQELQPNAVKGGLKTQRPRKVANP